MSRLVRKLDTQIIQNRMAKIRLYVQELKNHLYMTTDLKLLWLADRKIFTLAGTTSLC